MLSLGWARSCVKSRKQGNLMPWKGQTQGMWVARVQVKLSKVRGWCCLLSASGPYHRCLCKLAKHWSGFKVCCLWLLFQLLVALSVSVSSMRCLVIGWVNPLRLPILWGCPLLPSPSSVVVPMWLCCLQSAGEPPSGKHILYAAYKGYVQRWREICWVGKSESISCDRSNYLLLMWQRFLVCYALKCLCVSNHRKYPCPEEFTRCRRKVDIKLHSLFTGRELSYKEWVVQNSTEKSLSKLESGPAVWGYGLRTSSIHGCIYSVM